MKQIIFTAILILAFCFAAFAQDGNFEPLDRYGKVSANEEKAHFDNLFITLSRDKTYEGIIILQFHKKTSVGKRIKRVKRIINWSEFRKLDPNRITFMFSEEDFEQTIFLAFPPNYKLLGDLTKDYKSAKAEEFEQKIKELFPKK